MKINEQTFQELARQLQQQIQAMFIKNIRFFESKDPELAKRFQKYTAQQVRLHLTEEGYLNLVNLKLNNKPVYAYDPQQFCQDYVKHFAETPQTYKINFKAKSILDEENVTYVAIANRCHALLGDLPNRLKGLPLEDITDTMILNGIGMGYLIPQLLDTTDIRHLIVIEPHSDIFHASLHILDWELVYAHFERPNHSIKLVVGHTARNSMDELRKHFYKIGPHHLINAYHIEHLSSKEMQDVISKFIESARLDFLPNGYFDDEQVSLAHTVENWRSGIPPLRDYSPLENTYLDTPVFLIGNGPSLDESKEVILANQNKAIIVSCGTTLGSLRKMGIKPDIHIEMERTRPVVEWITTSTDEEYRKGILLLALNTVHPDVFKMFETRGMGMKTNDLGTHFFSKYISKGNNAINLAFCNPTVGNAGMAFSVALGFKNIYMFGLDLGFSAGEQHHSKLSTHYNMTDRHQKGLHLYSAKDDGNSIAPANFGGNVTTTHVYLSAKSSFERQIRAIPALNCHNTSNGIFIEGATPTRLKEIKLDHDIENKQALIMDIYHKHFYTDGIAPMESDAKVYKSFKPLIDALDSMQALLEQPQKNWDEAIKSIDYLHKLLLSLGLNDKSQYCYTLVKGSIYGFNIFLKRALYYGKDKEEAIEHFNKVRELFLEFIDLCKDKTENNLLTLDAKTRNLDQKVIR